MSDLNEELGLRRGARVGLDTGSAFDPTGYASTFTYGAGIQGLLCNAMSQVVAVDGSACLARLRSRLTKRELQNLLQACKTAEQAFATTVPFISAGMSEFEIAALLRSKLLTGAVANARCDGFSYCMSGPNSAQAYAAFQKSSSRAIASGDFILLHCNSYCGGFWTDITRTYSIGEPSKEKIEMMDTVLEARKHALSAVRPGINASAVDRAAREVLTKRGFGKAFKHATGHGVGFAAINHNALPRIHPLSDEILEEGMVFNIEPAVYIPGLGGIRHCDMVAVTPSGVDLLTPFHQEPRDLILS